MATEIDKIVYGGDLMIFQGGLPLAFSTDAKLSVKLGTRETSSKDSGNWVEKKGARLDWSASSSALYTEVLTVTTTTTSADEIYSLMILREPITIVFGIATGAAGAQTNDATKKKYTGTAIITAFDVNAPDGDNASYSISLEGTAALVMS